MKISHNNIPIAKSLLVFYLLLCGINPQSSLLSKDMTDIIANNRMIQHVVGFLTLVTLMIIFLGETTLHVVDIISYSLIAYLIFILSTKSNIYINIAIVVALFGVFVYETYLNGVENDTKNDTVLSNSEKQILVDKIYYKKMFMIIGIVVLTLSGVYIWSSNSTQSQTGQTQIGGVGAYTTFDFLFN